MPCVLTCSPQQRLAPVTRTCNATTSAFHTAIPWNLTCVPRVETARGQRRRARLQDLVPTRTEWGVQLRTMLDGPFDRTLTLSEYSRPYTRDQARSEAEQMARGQQRAERFADGKPGARLVARGLTGWHETT